DGTDTRNKLYSLDLEFLFSCDNAFGNIFNYKYPNTRFTIARVAAKATVSGLVTLLNYTL
ncbi:arylamine N-acetyltransferase, partial [Vibrio parahaemolyticus]|nr:arylamine N-acetyltransferase [Vibrio parahaemolyticus]